MSAFSRMLTPLYRRACCTLLLASLLAAASPAPAQTASADSATIVRVVESFIAAMAARDTAFLRAAALPSFVTVGVALPAGTATARSLDEFLIGMVREPRRFRGWIWSSTVSVDGPVAVLRAPYAVHFDGVPSHCGVDHYSLAQVRGRWLVSQVLYTRLTEGCPAPP